MFSKLFHKLSSPTIIKKYAELAQPWLWGATLISLILSLVFIFLSPNDYLHGSNIKFLYIHVPSAWMAEFIYIVMSCFSIAVIIWRSPVAVIIARNCVLLGVAYTFITLVTGSFWGRVAWSTWWRFDMRMTSVLVLFLMYIGLMLLWRSSFNITRVSRLAAVITMAGLLNLFIVKFSVKLWNTLHQGPSITLSGSTIDSSFLVPLFAMLITVKLFFMAILCMMVSNDLNYLKYSRLKARRLQNDL